MSGPPSTEVDIYTELVSRGINPEGAARVENYVNNAEKYKRDAEAWAIMGCRWRDGAREIERRVFVLTLAVIAILAANLLLAVMLP